MLFVALVLLLAAAWFVAGKLHRFAYWIGRKSDAEVQALAEGGWSVDRLPVAEGVALVGLVRPPQKPDARWILFVPGNSPSLLAGFRTVLDTLRGDTDTGLAFWAFRGFDASGGTPSPEALAADLLVQWRHLRELGARPERTEVWGYSLGSVLAAQLVARLAADGERPARLVLAAVGERIPVMRFGPLGRFWPDDVYDLTDALPRITVPTVIVHGTDDDALPIDEARRIAKALGAHATLHEVAGKGHHDLWDDLRRLAF